MSWSGSWTARPRAPCPRRSRVEALLILAGDVGGTKTYLARCKTVGDEPGQPIDLETLAGASYPSFEALLDDYLSRHPGPVKAIGLGVAGAVVNRAVRVTSLPWVIESEVVAARLGLKPSHVHIINDLVATGHGLRALPPSALVRLQEGTADEEACAGLIAAGTGLGETILVRVGVTHLPVPSEGGHADFAARTDEEIHVLKSFRAKYGRVSWERVLSGPGLAALGELFHEVPAWATHRGEMGPGGMAAVVSGHGMARDCHSCERALKLFVGAYGAEA
ncbi:MAG TPA: glucokinase, partial [Candidatus Angelobacter sp.]|nr:glucokinase [Candidatus Angelobacter sp.]